MQHEYRQKDLQNSRRDDRMGSVNEEPPVKAGGQNHSDSALPGKTNESKSGCDHVPILPDAPNLCNTKGASMSQEENDFQVEEEKPDHHFHTQIPNIIDDLGLDPYTFRVYVHLKRITGEGSRCWQSIPNMAELMGISEKKVREALKNLETGNNKLKLVLISKVSRFNEDGSQNSSLITVLNIWPQNGKYYREQNKNKNKGGVVPTGKGGGSPQEPGGVVPTGKGGGSPQEPKEQPYKNNPSVLSVVTPVGATGENLNLNLNSEEESNGPHEAQVNAGAKGIIKVTKSELYARICRTPNDWSAEDIRYAWRALCEYSGVIHDWWRFITGTVQNHKNKTRSKNTAKKENPSCPTSKNYKQTSLENVIAEPVLVAYPFQHIAPLW